ncbi:MAG: DNA polymerase IV [Gammaproteobacteria bacterium]|nr:MAG: DNA polymerase IV [Gammaproteobacteria bacterium]
MSTSTEKPPRWIAHVDLDAFFTSCEQRDQPEYRQRPVIVGAMPGNRGVVAAASYEARKFGIHSAMPIAEAARRCPDAVFLRPDMKKYQQASQQIFEILGNITPVVEKASIDEAYLDITGLDKLVGPPEIVGHKIRRMIQDAIGLTASVGIGPNRLIAKLGSEANKPDGLTVVTPDQVLDFLAPMPISNLRGLGRQTQKIFNRLHIQTVTELRAISLQILKENLGEKAAEKFHRQAHGIASDEVITNRQRKSISKENTFGSDIHDHNVLHDMLRKLTAEVARTARREMLAGTIVTLKIRFEGFETYSRQTTLAAPTHDERVILATAWSLFSNSNLPNKLVRLIGIGISGWEENSTSQADLFEPSANNVHDKKILEAIDTVTEKFGKPILQVGLSRKN